MTPITETVSATGHPPVVDDPTKSQRWRSDWRERYPARPVVTDWPVTRAERGEVDRIVAAAAAVHPSERVQQARRWGLPLLLDWLADQPGSTWQQRWLASGADAAREDWAQKPEGWLRRHGKYSGNQLILMTSSLLVIVGADLVRPSLEWLLTGGKKRKLVRNMVYGRDGAGFERLRRLCEQDPGDQASRIGRHYVSIRSHRRGQGRRVGRHHRR